VRPWWSRWSVPASSAQIDRDLELLKSLARLVRRYHPEGDRIRPDDIVGEFERVISNELDMQAEAANASLIRRNFENSNDLYIPAIHWDSDRQPGAGDGTGQRHAGARHR
jgi:ubiquinone biosynthesis protein